MGDFPDEREIVAPRADALLWAIRKALHAQHGDTAALYRELADADEQDNPHPLLTIFRALLDWHCSTPTFGRHLEPLIDTHVYATKLACMSESEFRREYPRAVGTAQSRAQAWADNARSMARDLTGEDDTE